MTGRFVFALAAFCAVTAGAFECSPAVRAKARDFIDNEKQFHLGFLPTEQSNPITATLEEDFNRSTLAGVQCLQRGDRQIPITMRHVFADAKFRALVDSMVETLKAPPRISPSHPLTPSPRVPRIVFSGCGATGRLSILLESMWRDFFHRRAAELTPAERALAERSASIMTGGDFALIKSVESFEDSMPGGERQAAALRIGEGDTFVAITEGGETSSVLGTLRYAAAHGARCFLVFNNPADILRAKLERCREAIDNPKVTVLDIYCGSMGLAGSTRMQATTSEQLLGSCALEAALCRVLPRFAKETAPDYTTAFESLLSTLESPTARASIAEAIEFEEALYRKHGRVTYFANDCMLDLFTDTTERSPTFMLPPFRSTDETRLAQSWAFVKNPLFGTTDCWQALFHRAPRCLEWTKDDYAAPGMPPLKNGQLPKISRACFLKYPIGNEIVPERTAGAPSAAVIVRAGKADPAFEAAAREQAKAFGETRLFAVSAVPDSPLEVWKHLAVKLTFNNLSTGTMVKMGRVSGNWMSWVSISNKKLIDRGIRLIAELGRIDYEEAALRLFAAEEWVNAQDWTGRETPCAVQIALKGLKRTTAEQSSPLAAERGTTAPLSFARLDALRPSWLIVVTDRASAIAPEQMTSHARTFADDGRRVVDVWTGHAQAGSGFKVVTEWIEGAEGRLEGTIRFEGYAGAKPVSEIQFPAVSVPFETDAKFLWGGSDMGFTFSSDLFAPGKYDYTRGMNAMQFGAILRSAGESLYYDYRDPAWNIKSVRARLSSDRIMTVCGVYPVPRVDERPVATGGIPYPSGVKLYRGGWYDAARLYRPWALNQSWAKNRPAKNPLADLDLWIWNRGLAADVIPPIERLADDLPGVKLALDWYWWHSNPYDTDYPFFWPPREGVDAFTKSVKRLTDRGIYSQVYVNGMCWDIDSTHWTADKAGGLMHTRKGDVRAHAFNKYNNHRLAWMCGEAPAHHDAMSGLLANLRRTGLTGQYLDMIGNASFDVCWNPAHRHVRNGGHAVTDGYREMLARLGRENPGYPLTTEGSTELYMDRCDGSIICNVVSGERMGSAAREIVPLFTAVYHGSYALFGSYALPDAIPPWDPKWPDADRWPAAEEKAWHELYPDQFYLEMARPVIWGAQPMVCSLRPKHRDDPAFKSIYRFILDTANFYHDNKDFLWAGEMTSPDGFVCAVKDVDFFARMIFTKKDKARVIRKRQPCVLHSCWRNARGEESLFLCNYTAEPQEWSFRGQKGTLAPHSYQKRALSNP